MLHYLFSRGQVKNKQINGKRILTAGEHLQKHHTVKELHLESIELFLE